MKTNELNEIFDFITEREIATSEEVTLVTKINGWNAESLNSIIYARTGSHDVEQCEECEG